MNQYNLTYTAESNFPIRTGTPTNYKTHRGSKDDIIQDLKISCYAVVPLIEILLRWIFVLQDKDCVMKCWILEVRFKFFKYHLFKQMYS
jgi:hypothetical protein